MNRNFIFVFILLAALSLVNAMPHELRKRTTSFKQCPNSKLANVPILDVTISPDPVVSGASDTFTVSGTLEKDIVETTPLVIEFFDASGTVLGTPYAEPICGTSGGPDCPIKAGTKFTTTATITAPDSLPSQYFIGVAVAESPEVALGCAVADVGSTSSKMPIMLPF